MAKHKKPVQAPSKAYDLGKVGVVATVRNHYRRIVVVGKENLPKDGRMIIAPCHQNALMDPLLVLRAIGRPTVFLARADVINMPALANFFYFLRILPVYRIRDGRDSLIRNADIFDQSKGVLLDDVPLCLMAEGRHNDKHQLLPLVKGMFRIAGETQKDLGDTPLYIVPTGIDYDEYERPFSNAVIHFGKPIPVEPFMEQYIEKEPIALNQMKEALSEALSGLMLDIKSRECYNEIYALCNACNRTVRKEDKLKNTVWNRFQVRRRIAERLDKMVADGCEKAAPMMHLGKEYKRVCEELHINEKMPGERWGLLKLCVNTILVGLLAIAACWVGWIGDAVSWALICYPLLLLPTYLIPKKMIKDPQFRSSFNYGIRLIVGLLYAIILAIVVGVVYGGLWSLVTIVYAAMVACASGHIVSWFRDLWDNWRYRCLQLIKPKQIAYLESIIKEVSSAMKA